MTKAEIIAMALEAGAGLSCVAEPLEHPWKFSQVELERFAARVAAAEREACAAIAADAFYGNAGELNHVIAAAIHARGAA